MGRTWLAHYVLSSLALAPRLSLRLCHSLACTQRVLIFLEVGRYCSSHHICIPGRAKSKASLGSFHPCLRPVGRNVLPRLPLSLHQDRESIPREFLINAPVLPFPFSASELESLCRWHVTSLAGGLGSQPSSSRAEWGLASYPNVPGERVGGRRGWFGSTSCLTGS